MKWNNGDVVHGFNIMKVDHVEEVNSDVYMMEHIKSGAKLMYLDSADDNKVFISVSARHRTIQRNAAYYGTFYSLWLKKVPFKRTLCGTCKRLFEYLFKCHDLA